MNNEVNSTLSNENNNNQQMIYVNFNGNTISNSNDMNNNITQNTQIINNSFESNLENADTITLYDINKPKPVEDMPYIFCHRSKGRVIADSRFCSSCGNQVSR